MNNYVETSVREPHSLDGSWTGNIETYFRFALFLAVSINVLGYRTSFTASHIHSLISIFAFAFFLTHTHTKLECISVDAQLQIIRNKTAGMYVFITCTIKQFIQLYYITNIQASNTKRQNMLQEKLL